jgi:hypothetical protein
MNVRLTSGSVHGGVASETEWPSSSRRVEAYGNVARWRQRGHRDAETARICPDLLDERSFRRRCPPGIAGLVTGEDVEQRGRVLDRSSERPGRREPLERGERRPGHTAARRLQPEHPAARRGDPDRPAAVRPVRDRQQAGRKRRGRAAARASGGPGEVVGVAGRPEDVVVGLRAVAELGHVGLADHDRSGGPEALDHERVLVRHVALVELRAVRRTDALGRRDVLDRDGDTEEGWERGAAA